MTSYSRITFWTLTTTKLVDSPFSDTSKVTSKYAKYDFWGFLSFLFFFCYFNLTIGVPGREAEKRWAMMAADFMSFYFHDHWRRNGDFFNSAIEMLTSFENWSGSKELCWWLDTIVYISNYKCNFNHWSPVVFNPKENKSLDESHGYGK